MAFGIIYRLSTLILPLLAVMVLQVFGKEASCSGSLGMEDGTIKDSQITVSSVYSGRNIGTYARLHKNLQPRGAWCPSTTNAVINKIKYDEYIQIDLLNLTTIRKVATQGRELAGGREYTKTYQISYSRDDKIWLYYKRKDNSETKVFSGNNDVKTVVENKIDPRIIARYVRIHPGYLIGHYTCLRLELYGCPWYDSQGILSYTMPEGQVIPNGKHKYKDTNYTGTNTGGMLHGGTGLLTDGEIGHVADSKQYGGEGWVGWMQAEQHRVNITFEFDFLRKFSNVTITVNINKKRSYSLFNETQIFIGKKEDDFSLSSALQYCPEQSEAEMEIVNVNLSLCNNVGKFIRIQLYPGGKWLLISEIKFNSVYLHVFDNKTTFQTCFDSMHGPCFTNSSVSLSLTPLSLAPLSPTTTLSCTESSSSPLLYILIALVCVFCVIGLVIIALLLSRRESKKSKRNQDVSLEMKTPSLLNDNNDVPEVPVSSNQPPNNEENQAEDEEGYVIPNNVTPHHPEYTALMKRTNEDDNDNNDVQEVPTSSNQLPNNEENQAEDDIEEGYEFPDNNVTQHHPEYTALMKRTNEDDHSYQELIK